MYAYTMFLANATFPLQLNCLLLSMSLIPQIIHNLIRNKKVKFEKYYLLLYIYNLIIFMYRFIFSNLFFLTDANYPLCLWMVILATIQIYLLKKQSTEGPYLCFSKWYKYNYYL